MFNSELTAANALRVIRLAAEIVDVPVMRDSAEADDLLNALALVDIGHIEALGKIGTLFERSTALFGHFDEDEADDINADAVALATKLGLMVAVSPDSSDQ